MTSLRDRNLAGLARLTRPVDPNFETQPTRDHTGLKRTAKNSNTTISKVPLRRGHSRLGSFSGGLRVLLEHKRLQRLQIPGALVLLHLLTVVENFQSRVGTNVRLGASRLARGAIHGAHFDPSLAFEGLAELLPCGCHMLTVTAPGGVKLDEPQSVLLLQLVLIGTLVSGSWDKTVRFWDIRVATPVLVQPQFERVCSMSLVEQHLVVATEGRGITNYDMRCMRQPGQIRESSLHCNTLCVCCDPNGTGYALSSEEGHVAMESFDMSKTDQGENFRFRTEPVDGRFFSVNAIAFHPTYYTLATGCSAGHVTVWDGKRKEPIYKFSRYPISVASFSFSRDGLLLAVASSYTEGDIHDEYAAIFVRRVNEAEVKAKL